MRRWLRTGVVLGVLAAMAVEPALRAEPPAPAVTPSATTLPPLPAAFPSAQQFAKANGGVWGEFSAPSEGGAKPGDFAWALVTAIDDTRQKQWCVKLLVDVPTPDEQRQIKPLPPLVLYTDTGTRLEFNNEVILLELRTAGPLVEKVSGAPRVVQKTARAGVNGEHLKLGFAGACAAVLKLGAAHEASGVKEKGGTAISTTPFPENVIKEKKAAAARAGVTPEDEKVLAGAMPALMSFLQIALTTPGLQEILKEVLDVPLWSIIAKGGKVDPSFSFETERMKQLEAKGDEPRYVLPVLLRLNGKPALRLDLIVTTPRPPLVTTAGIVAVYATHPTNPKKRATIEIVSALRPTG